MNLQDPWVPQRELSIQRGKERRRLYFVSSIDARGGLPLPRPKPADRRKPLRPAIPASVEEGVGVVGRSDGCGTSGQEMRKVCVGAEAVWGRRDLV